MDDYWGAQVYWPPSGSSAGEFGSWYTMPDAHAGNGDYTAKPTGDGSTGDTIEKINRMISDAQPAHLSALADQWQNMYNLLDAVRNRLHDESVELYEEHWKSGEARDAFMRAGPGELLAYLDEWMQSAIRNQVALNTATSIVLEYQGKMSVLYQQYLQALQDAQNLGGWTRFWDGVKGFGSMAAADENETADKIDQVKQKAQEYNLKAQQLAYSMGQAMWDSFIPFGSGHGPIYRPPDAVIDPPMLNLPLPPARPNVPAPPPVPTVPTVPTPTVPAVPTPTVPTPTVPTPTVPVPPPMPTPMPVPVSVPVIPVIPMPVGVPVEPTLPGTGLTGDPAGGLRPGSAPGAGGLFPRAAQAGAGALGSELTNGVRGLGRSLGGMQTPPGGQGSRRRNAEPARPVVREPGTDDLFGGRGSTAPPVLNNARRDRRRGIVPPAVLSDEISTGLPGRDDAAPPILGRPAAPGTARSARRDRPAEPTPDLVTPALRAPVGAGQAGLDEVPTALRAPAPARADTVAGELTRARKRRPDEEAPAGDAFAVETPGGGVLGGRPADEGYVAEAPVQVRAVG